MSAKIKCEYCGAVLPEILTLQMFLEQKKITKDIYSLIEPIVIRYNTFIEEIETPCNVHYFDRIKCFQCIRKPAKHW